MNNNTSLLRLRQGPLDHLAETMHGNPFVDRLAVQVLRIAVLVILHPNPHMTITNEMTNMDVGADAILPAAVAAAVDPGVITINYH